MGDKVESDSILVDPKDTKRPVKMKLIEDSDRVVVVLGAGASISETKEIRGDNNLPPTDLNFLSRAQEACPKEYDAFRILYDQVWQNCEPYPLKCQRMEQVFASAYWKVMQTSGSSAAGHTIRELFDRMIILLRGTIAATTEVAAPDQHLELFRQIHQRAKDFNIISLNYDVLADRALRSGTLAGDWRWHYANGYCFKPTKVSVPRQASDVCLYKLHGSMNWYIPIPGKRRKTAYNSKAPIYIPKPGSTTKAPVWHRRRDIRGHSTQRIFPLLVPPVYEKGSQINGVLNQIWNGALDCLSQATLVIVWGYSLPTTDYHTEVLFAQTARKSKFRLLVINPDPAALGRVTYVCGHRWNRWFFRIGHLFTALQNGD